MFKEQHHYHVIQAHHAIHLKWSKADPKPVGYISSYSFGENYSLSVSEHPTIHRPLPLYAAKPDGLTTREWENDIRTRELILHLKRLELILNSR